MAFSFQGHACLFKDSQHKQALNNSWGVWGAGGGVRRDGEGDTEKRLSDDKRLHHGKNPSIYMDYR